MAKRDYYEILGVDRDADEATIKRAYRSLAMKYHPDRNPGDRQAIEKMKEINEAYAVLSDREKRRLYDTYGHAGLEGFTTADLYRGVDFTSLFREFGLGDFDFGFGDTIFDSLFATRRTTRRQRRGADITYELEVTLEDVALGSKKQIEVPTTRTCNLCLGTGAGRDGLKTCERCKGTGQIVFEQRSGYTVFRQISICNKCRGTGSIITEPCSVCSGKGVVVEMKEITVHIPKGADTGYVIRIPGEGEIGENHTSPGDLYVVLKVQKHPYFERRGDDIYIVKEITFAQAALGAEVEVPTLNGNRKLEIPAGTQTDTVFKISGEGIPRLDSRGRGDLYVTVKVVTPQNLTEEEKKLLREFDRLQQSRLKKAMQK